jgi:hypothetical protein
MLWGRSSDGLEQRLPAEQRQPSRIRLDRFCLESPSHSAPLYHPSSEQYAVSMYSFVHCLAHGMAAPGRPAFTSPFPHRHQTARTL